MSSLNLLSFLMSPAPTIQSTVSPSAVSGQLPTNVSGRIMALYELSLTRHALFQSIVHGHVLKAPEFNVDYTGPKLADLDVISAYAAINPQQEIQFTGEVLIPINVSQTAIYSFLVNRGGARSPGPLAGRPRISFDAVVQVTTGPAGITGTVSLLNPQEQLISTTTLPASSVQIVGAAVKVTVPLSLLPSSAPPSARPATRHESFTFSANLPGISESDAAGFVPEYTTLVISPSTHR